MRVLVTGVESSGTKALVQAFEVSGVEATHYSPNYWEWDGYEPRRAYDYDAVVVIVRTGYCATRSMVENGHAKNLHRARVMQAHGLARLLTTLGSFANVHIVTYESLVYEPDAFEALWDELGLESPPLGFGNANAKYYGGKYFREQPENLTEWTN